MITQVTRVWRVYGKSGHRIRESFNPSYKYDWSTDGDVRIVEVENADKTGTNDYCVVRITRNTAKECMEEFRGQIYDGIFENCRTGKVEEIKELCEVQSTNGTTRNKEAALRDFREVIRSSWTYARLTDEERERLWEELDGPFVRDAIRGGYDARCDILSAIYSAFLAGVGYAPSGWREPEEEQDETPLF